MALATTHLIVLAASAAGVSGSLSLLGFPLLWLSLPAPFQGAVQLSAAYSIGGACCQGVEQGLPAYAGQWQEGGMPAHAMHLLWVWETPSVNTVLGELAAREVRGAYGTGWCGTCSV